MRFERENQNKRFQTGFSINGVIMKINLVLFMYDIMSSGKIIERAKFCNDNDVTERTFYRYLNRIEDYVKTHKPNYRITNIKKGAYCLAPVVQP